jgi:putative transposase
LQALPSAIGAADSVAVTEGSGAYPQVGRKAPAAGAHIFLGQTNIFFVTVNAKHRVPWINQQAVQSSLVGIWRDEATAWREGYYLLMPDHLHLFCAPDDLHFGIDQWMMFSKREFSRRRSGELWEWQRRAFHHRMRDRMEYEDKLAYVRENPLRKGLVKKPEDWPFQGRVHDIQWIGD